MPHGGLPIQPTEKNSDPVSSRGDSQADIEGSRTNNSPRVPERTTSAKVVVTIVCFWTNFICVGFATGLGVLFVPVVEAFQSSHAQTSLMGSLCMGVVFSGALFIGPVVTWLTPGNSMVLGGLLAIAGCVGGTLAPNVEVIILCIGFVTGLGLCFAHLASFITMVAIFPQRKGLGVSILTCGSGIGGVLTPMLNVSILDIYGWRGTFLILGGMTFHVCLSGIFIRCLTKNHFKNRSCEKEPDRKSLTASLNLHLFKNISYVLFLLCQLPVFTFFLSQLFFIVDLGQHKGQSLRMSSFLLSGLSLANVGGSLLGGMLNSMCNITGLRLTAIASIVGGTVSIVFVFVHQYELIMVVAVCFGACFGLFVVSGPIATLEICGTAAASAALSYLFGTTGTADLIAGPVGGAIRDWTGQYTLLFYLSAGTGVTMGVLFLFLELMVRRANTNHDDVWKSSETIVTSISST